ncbi:MAG TPA: Spy/CpxP family protein refolding chaperone, partial [Beijerinckiaceae bacterium]|nr:Spy/CpxP family protein refolding chaperone [Beijerinckiaceae bacterium]
MIALCAALLATAALAQDRPDRSDRGERGGDLWRDREWNSDFWRGERGGRGAAGGERMMGRFSPEDIEAFTDARIAALRAGLKLTAEQEKLWPPLEEAIRALVRQRRDQARAWRESRERDDEDIAARLRALAEQQAARAEALKKLADAVAPLHASFDEGQKRRFNVLTRRMRGEMMQGMGGEMQGMRGGGMRPWHDQR